MANEQYMYVSYMNIHEENKFRNNKSGK